MQSVRDLFCSNARSSRGSGKRDARATHRERRSSACGGSCALAPRWCRTDRARARGAAPPWRRAPPRGLPVATTSFRLPRGRFQVTRRRGGGRPRETTMGAANRCDRSPRLKPLLTHAGGSRMLGSLALSAARRRGVWHGTPIFFTLLAPETGFHAFIHEQQDRARGMRARRRHAPFAKTPTNRAPLCTPRLARWCRKRRSDPAGVRARPRSTPFAPISRSPGFWSATFRRSWRRRARVSPMRRVDSPRAPGARPWRRRLLGRSRRSALCSRR